MFRAPISFRGARQDLRTLADEDLIRLVVSDDGAQAFEVIFDRHASAAFSLAYRMCGRRGTAEDIVQEAFLSLWRSGARYDPTRGSVRSWVLGVVHNRAIDLFRRETVRTDRDISDEGFAERIKSGEDTETEVQRRQAAGQVRDALHGLPADQRRVIELAYFGGFTHSQIAEMLNLPAGTVKGRMRLGLTKMRAALDDPAAVLP
ncbi:MAG: RNA polymerase sigma factor [Solirubrobacteraceae bacterium]